METQPKEITPVYISAVLLPNGEIISKGKTVGWFKDYADQLESKEFQDLARKWKCRECKSIAHVSYEELADHGSPSCDECGDTMVLVLDLAK